MMGYRHQFISDTLAPKKKILPKWFICKYDQWINFEMDYWASFTEYKRYGHCGDLHGDIQIVLNEIDRDRPVRILYFADESLFEHPDISLAMISKNKIIEKQLWEENDRLKSNIKSITGSKGFMKFIKNLDIDRMISEEGRTFADTFIIDVLAQARKTKAGIILRLDAGSGVFEINLEDYLS